MCRMVTLSPFLCSTWPICPSASLLLSFSVTQPFILCPFCPHPVSPSAPRPLFPTAYLSLGLPSAGPLCSLASLPASLCVPLHLCSSACVTDRFFTGPFIPWPLHPPVSLCPLASVSFSFSVAWPLCLSASLTQPLCTSVSLFLSLCDPLPIVCLPLCYSASLTYSLSVPRPL